MLDLSVELHALRVLGADDLPRIAKDDPVVRMLHLIAVDKFLFEEAVLVMDAVTDGGKVVRGERVEKARGEAAKATIAQPHVLLGVAQGGKIKAKFADGGDRIVVETGVVEVVLH